MQCSVEVIVGENTGKTKIRLDMWYFELGNLEYVVLDKYKDFLPHRSVFFSQKERSVFFFRKIKTEPTRLYMAVRITSYGSMITSNSAFVNVFFQGKTSRMPCMDNFLSNMYQRFLNLFGGVTYVLYY